MGTRVYVGRLPYRATERDIERFFRGFGRIKEIFLKNGYGFVEFDDYRDADDACFELNGREMMGERLIVEIARGTPHGRDRYGWRPSHSSGRHDKKRSRSRSRSRNRSRSKSLEKKRRESPPPRRRSRTASGEKKRAPSPKARNGDECSDDASRSGSGRRSKSITPVVSEGMIENSNADDVKVED